MSRELGRVARHGGRFSLVMVDLDGLKAINDTLGHNAGDARLQALGARPARTPPAGRTPPTALGGDEFAVLLPGASPDQAQRVMARVGEAAGPGPVQLGRGRLPVRRHHRSEALVGAADARLYRRRARARRAATAATAATAAPEAAARAG